MQAHTMVHAIHTLRIVPVPINFFFILMKCVFPVPQRPLKTRSVELQCHVLVDGRRKPLCTDVVIAAHLSVRTTMISLYTFENFLRFLLQDKHNASYFSNMSWRGTPQSKCKSNKKAAIITYLVVDLFACLNGIGGFYSFIPLPFRCGITGCRMLCRSFSNCSLNHSPMGRKSTVRMNLPMSAYLHH